MIRINQIKLDWNHTKEQLEKKICKVLGVPKEQIITYEIAKKSIDARKKPMVFFIYSIDVEIKEEARVLQKVLNPNVVSYQAIPYRFEVSGNKKWKTRPIVVGSGPAGLFCAYYLALGGFKPILLERGECVEERQKRVDEFWKTGKLSTESNVQFGEGGAGTFSDGKLNTLVKDKFGRNKEVLRLFVEAGASKEILYESKPHIGTDVLIHVVKYLRESICQNGGEVRFLSEVTDVLIQTDSVTGEKKISGVMINNQEKIESEAVVLAIGHSARDTFEVLYERQIPMEAKAFAVGLRVEHPQKMINQSQYGQEKSDILKAAPYKLTAQTTNGRGVYSFCMCPGGYVVNASSESEKLAINGMSYQKRDGRNANSAIIVSVTPADFEGSGPLAGIAFQRKLEERAYQLCKGKVPVQLYRDFKENRNSKSEDFSYMPAIKGEYETANVRSIMPEVLNTAFIDGMEQFEHSIKGFANGEVILSGIESRTSSPVRMHRDDTLQSAVKGLYPCGEGAGYAGGIMSAAMDGMKVAEAIAKE